MCFLRHLSVRLESVTNRALFRRRWRVKPPSCREMTLLLLIKDNNQKRDIPGPFGVRNGYTLESTQKYTPRATRLAKNKSYPSLRNNGPGTPVSGYYAWLSTVFRYFFLLNHWPIIVYIVLHCCFGR